jgi:hypothetical protein
MVTKFIFYQDFFGFSKNGQKKCPKLKIPNTFGKIKSLKYNKSPKQLKEKGGEILNIISSII